MWQFLLGTTVGTYLGTYYNFRPYLEALYQFYQRRLAEVEAKDQRAPGR